MISDPYDAELLEEQLGAQAALLERAAREKSDLLVTLAHELRNSLAPIAYAAAMIRADASAETLARVRETLERQVSKMVALLDARLDEGSGPRREPQ